MKTLLVSEVFPPQKGGSGRWFHEVYGRLPHDQYMVAAGEHALQDDFDDAGNLKVARLPLSLAEWGIASWTGLVGYWRVIRRLRRIIREHDIEQVHCGRCMPEGVAALALRYWMGVPFVCYVHGEDVNTAHNSREHSFLVRQVLKHAQYVIANSENTGDLLKSDWRVPSSRIEVLHPGVDTERFAPAERDENVRESLGWGQRPVVLTVGRLQKRKGHDQMIAALPTIRRHVPDVLYAIVGDGEERESLENTIRQVGVTEHVQFLGETNDEQLIRAYQQCDLFALPNREVNGDIEGFGMVLLEAQACGKPVIAGDSGGTRETMQTPETGRIIPCERPEPLADGVVELLRDWELRDRMGKAGRNWVESNFNWDGLGQRAAALFRQKSHVRRGNGTET